ncbi:MAG: transpeptidase family protein [Spirochaetales bacterium]|nr:transpeptidase family protein [Spirochaetales bacterium]
MIINKNRFIIFGIFTAIIVLILIWQFFSVMILAKPGEEHLYAASDVERGPIWDRNGEVLAMQDELFSVAAWRPDLGDRNKTAILLSPIIDLAVSEIQKKLDGDRGSAYIKRKLSSSQSEKIRELIESGAIPGIVLQPEYGRNYPNKNIAGHVLGYVGDDNNGLAGIEYAFDEYLSPRPAASDKGTVYGNHLYLTLDINIQYMCETLAGKTCNDQDADAVMILVMNAKNGDFLAIASYPDYDPNKWQEATPDQLYPRPFTYAYEPGSVFKIFSISSFLQTQSISEDDHFYCNGHYEKIYENGTTDTIDCLGVHGNVNARGIIIKSCNAGAAYASDYIDSDSFYYMLTQFGFGAKTALPFPGESNGLIKRPEDWSGRSKATISFGQEILVSAVQVVSAATVLTNRGQLLEPHIVSKILTPDDEVILQKSRKPVAEVMTPENVDKMISYMVAAASAGGTARRSAIEGITVAAKTGTAQVIDPKTGTYSEKRYIASTLAILPAEDPELIIYVVIDYPRKESYYGGVIAAPVVSELGNEMVSYLGIPRNDQIVITHPGKIVLQPAEKIEIGDIVPDLTGLSKKELAPLFLDKRLKIEINGEGWVVRQYPPAGTPVAEGLRLVLELQ